MIQEALLFAVEKHKYCFRKYSLLPYVIHPIDVMKMTNSWGIVDIDILTICLLHDTLEDTDTTAKELEDKFGYNIREGVENLTFYGTNKKHYMESFLHKDIRYLIVKIADRICNVYDFLKNDAQYAEKYFNKALPLWEALVKRKEEIVAQFSNRIYENIFKEYEDLVYNIANIIKEN